MFGIQDALGDLSALGIAAVAIVVGLAVHWLAFRVAHHLARRTESTLDESLLEHTHNPVGLLIVLGSVLISTVFMASEARAIALDVVLFVGIIASGWLVVGLTLVGMDAMLRRLPSEAEDDIEARALRTQVGVLQRFGALIIWLVAVALALLTIPGVAPLAASLLAGAGVVGIVLGVAAGPIIGNFIAGIQIAFTQPVKIGDVVVIEGEWGTIGEITATYVVVYIWDKRRLVVPLTRIVNEPVENWTRRGHALLGYVKLYLDYRAPVEALRLETKRILDESGLWDGETWSVLVTGADDRTVTVRALYSAPDASTEWSLRCLVREKLIAFLQEHHPEALPTRRELAEPAAG